MTGEHVAVVGGGASAAEESVFLTRFAERVTLLVRGDELKAAPVALEKIAENEKIDVRYRTEVAELRGGTRLEEVVVRHRDSGEVETLTPRAVFVFVGLSPNSGFLPPGIERDANGFVLTGRTLETSMSGVFAAGDVRHGATHQAASAAGEGATVALMVRECLKGVGQGPCRSWTPRSGSRRRAGRGGVGWTARTRMASNMTAPS